MLKPITNLNFPELELELGLEINVLKGKTVFHHLCHAFDTECERGLLKLKKPMLCCLLLSYYRDPTANI